MRKLVVGLMLGLVLVAIGVGAWFWFSGVDSIDDFDYPNEISGYVFERVDREDGDCGMINGGEVCFSSLRIIYTNSENKKIHVLPMFVSEGEKNYLRYMKDDNNAGEIAGNVYRGVEEWEIWWNSDDFLIMTQEYSESGVTRADFDNVVIQYFLEKYVPIEIDLG
jgi:hypothetical protein